MMEEKPLKSKQAERGKETLFRVTYNHQSKLVQIADYKANMIITVSAMVIPIAIIVLSSLVARVFAVQAARPKLIKAHKPGTAGHKASLLFFGVIASYSQTEYLSKMKELLAAGDEMYEHMTIDIYYQGLILKRKYNLLVFAYQILMWGFVVSVLIFLCMLFYGL